AAASLGHRDLLFRLSQIPKNMATIAVAHDRARWGLNDEILGRPAMAIRAGAGAAVFGPPVFALRQAGEAVRAGPSADEDGAALAAVAPVGTSFWHVFFSAEAAAARATLPAAYKQRDPIDKRHAIRLAELTREESHIMKPGGLTGATSALK